jgi:hypothetical protein
MEFGSQAHMHLAIAGQTQAVSIATEVVRHRRYQTQPKTQWFKSVIAGRS